MTTNLREMAKDALVTLPDFTVTLPAEQAGYLLDSISEVTAEASRLTVQGRTALLEAHDILSTEFHAARRDAERRAKPLKWWVVVGQYTGMLLAFYVFAAGMMYLFSSFAAMLWGGAR